MKSFKRKTCRACGSGNLYKWLDLGEQPPANNLIPKDQIDGSSEYLFPLVVYYCENCTLVQLLDVVDPKLLFDNYLYHSSTAQSFRDHFKQLALNVITRFDLTKRDLVVDIGSNDGIFLKPLKEQGIRVLGVDPAFEIAEQASDEGIPTVPFYLNKRIAERIVEDKGGAALVTGSNVFAHIDDMKEVFESIKILLDDHGTLIMEVAYFPEMLKLNTFDLIYHEHLCYYTATSLQAMGANNGFTLYDIEFVPVHGGSIRAYFGKDTMSWVRSANLLMTLQNERSLLMNPLFVNFPKAVEDNKSRLIQTLKDLKKSGKSIIGYGAPAKMSTMTNYFNLSPQLITYIIDDSPYKQGHYSPGKHIYITNPDRLKSNKPDYIVIFAWNFAMSIMEKLINEGYKGKFIVPFPEVKVL